MAAPLPGLLSWVITRTVESSIAASTLSVPSDRPVVDHHHVDRPSGTSTARTRRTISATVVRSL